MKIENDYLSIDCIRQAGKLETKVSISFGGDDLFFYDCITNVIYEYLKQRNCLGNENIEIAKNNLFIGLDIINKIKMENTNE